MQTSRLSSRATIIRPFASPETSGQPSVAQDDDDELLIERQIGGKRKPKPKAPTPAPGSYKVISAQRDQVYGGGPLNEIQKFENGIITYLTIVFCVILAEGIYLAASGFLTPELDQFGMDIVYPAFAPTLGLFLVSSSLYGLWKTGSGREEEKKE